MKPCIALVRGINVGGHNLVGMAKLRDFLIAAGFAEVRTLLQSGNVVFQTSLRIDAALETLLEKEAKKQLGLEADFLCSLSKPMERDYSEESISQRSCCRPESSARLLLQTSPQAAAN